MCVHNLTLLGHVCNLKEFKVYGGLDPSNMKELLHKGIYVYIYHIF